ncbi:hypothetical protein, variant [Salpingoeca rosetta]|uniref:Uncharacterized protein n=1 Tax=Salpingoeca rosetta (strain ATCC 50818 / BSB-021) TaxID=946362 RepID=F2UGM9_SALR5|nr:hypothetical protein, variant [Salpingoeca rosetta]EGD75778.1 hypothetical protein, variant [Salpingoeca rosetta]|eukprot:XP_004991699.1 hypothetical protein, variant [Salpingoeca rosetta]
MSEVRRVKLRGRRGSVWTLPVATAKRQYGGRGLARASLWIPLPSEAGGQHFTAASWLSRFKEAYEEHVEGFHGRAFSASVRRQRQANMDWKVLQHAKWTGMIPGQQADEAGADRSMSGSVDREGGSDRAHDYDPHTQQHGKPRSRRRRHKDQGTHSSTAPSDGNNTAAAVAGGGSDPYTNKKMHSLMQQTMSQVSNKRLTATRLVHTLTRFATSCRNCWSWRR